MTYGEFGPTLARRALRHRVGRFVRAVSQPAVQVDDGQLPPPLRGQRAGFEPPALPMVPSHLCRVGHPRRCLVRMKRDFTGVWAPSVELLS
jgi:hypothetical protein